MSFLDALLGLFGKKKNTRTTPAGFGNSHTKRYSGMGMGMSNNNTTTVAGAPRKNRQVYESRKVEPPEWAQGLSKTDLIMAIGKHIQCRFVPKFEMKRIMSTNIGPDGNLIPEFDGIAASCGALQQTGLKVARQQGLTQAYRYVDENMAYRACCDTPAKCPFYQAATGDMDAVNKQRR